MPKSTSARTNRKESPGFGDRDVATTAPDRVLRNPVRRRVIARMRETGVDYSARDMYRELEERGEIEMTESNFAFHFRLLRKAGYLEEVETVQVRGAQKVICRATDKAVLDDSARMSLIAEALSEEPADPFEMLRRIRWIVADSGRSINEAEV